MKVLKALLKTILIIQAPVSVPMLIGYIYCYLINDKILMKINNQLLEYWFNGIIIIMISVIPISMMLLVFILFKTLYEDEI